MSMISGYTVRHMENGANVSQDRPRRSSVSQRSADQATDSFSLQNREKSTIEDDATDAFDPNSTAIMAWEHILLICLLYLMFMIPYFLSFQPHAVEKVNIAFVVVLIVEFFFLVDIYIRAHTGYYANGNLVRSKQRTRRRYFRSYQFVMDCVAIVPIPAIAMNDDQLLVRLMVIKLVRCLRLGQFVSSLDEFYAKHFVMLKLLKVLVSMIYMAHVLACIRYSFGYNDGHNHWLPPATESHHPIHTQYLGSLFWSVGIMTGLFEGELPRHNSEFLFTTLVALCGFSMFTTLVATIFVISKCESGQSEAVEARINQLVHLLKFHRVPESQQTQAIEYLRRYYTDEESNDREAAKILCRSVANDIQVELLHATFAQIPIFEGCSDQFIVAMTSLLEMIAIPAQTTLFSAGEDGDAMYIVHSGVLAVIIKSVTVREIRKGVCFGELSVFSSIRRTASVISTTYSILYKLSRFHCERVLDGYPNCAVLIEGHVKSALTKIKGGTNYVVNTVVSPVIAASGRNNSLAGLASTLTRVLTMNGEITARSARRSITDSAPAKRRSLVIPAQIDSVDSQRPSQVSVGNHSNPRRSIFKPTPVKVHVNPRHGIWRYPSQVSVGNHSNPRRSILKPTPVKVHVNPRHGIWRYILRNKCIDQHSRVRWWWLILLQVSLCHSWIMIPVQIVFPLWQRPSWQTQAIDCVFIVGLFIDMLLNFSLSFIIDSEKIMDPMRSAKRYFEGPFFFDLMCTIPYEYLHMSKYGLLRLPRLLRVLHVKEHLNEIEYFFPMNTRRQLTLLGILLIMMFHIVACIHFAISYIEGFNPTEEEAWISSTRLCLRRVNATHLENCDGDIFCERTDISELRNISAMEYSRSLYYAVGVLASPGKSIEPVSDVQLIAALILMLSGFLITAIVVDNVQKRFTASAFEQKEFFATSTRIQLFLRRQNAPLAIHHRVKSFLDYWWSSHRGAVIGELLADLPRPIRLDVLRSICLPVLQTLALLQGIRPVRDKLEEVMVENAKFILYGQGEIVYRHGDYVAGMFFLLEGEVCIVTATGRPQEVPRGGFFGTAALTQQERGEGYTEHVSANSGCILLFVSREQLQAMEAIFPQLKVELLTLEQRLMNNKLAKSAVNKGTQRRIRRQSTVVMIKDAIFGTLKPRTVYDPDSMFILTWETWVLFVMTAQWILVMFQACFPLEGGHRNADILMLFMEICFIVDIYIRSHLGFYEYGNKMMNFQRIKRAYLHSGTFVLDIVALLPLYIVNWSVPIHERWDLLNINKLLRLFKVPTQLHALETRYLKRTTELRMFKLLYYTFMLSHVLACIWFNFASKVAVPNFTSSLMPTTKKTAFGENHWLPSEHLEHGPSILQYMASLYWSFGLMSASSEPEFPKTTAQCIFSVITMTSGFFLFAYVVGNFTDIIELTSSETREFNAKMGAVRQMLNHFQLPDALQERLKTFYLFKRFHTITQEHILVHCLPPSLLTDIRLVHLKRMIEKVEFLSGMEGSVTRMLVSQFTQVLVSRGEFICRLGEQSSDMYFVFTGVLDVLLPFGAVNVSTRENSTGNKVTSRPSVAKMDAPAKLWRLGIRKGSSGPAIQKGNVVEQLRKVNEISAGSYFGENGLFTNGRRNAYIQAQTSCILYKLSRGSLELVFDRYPEWKQKVMRIVNIHREQTRLLQLSREEQQRGTDAATGLMLSRADIMNQRAERIKDELQHVRLQHGENGHTVVVTKAGRTLLKWFNRFVLTPLHCLIEGTEVQSEFHLEWLRFMVICILYVSMLTPYELAMDDLDRSTPMAIVVKAFGLLCELVFILDVWFSWHVRESPASMELYEQDLRTTYKKERMLWDTIAAIPFYRFLSDFHCRPWLRLLRCLKIFNVVSYLDELNRRSVTYEITRFWYICLLYLLLIYWAACAYLAVATEVGFGTEWDAWLPSQELVISNPKDPSPSQLALRFLRGLFFATTTFVKKARNLAPETATLYAFHITISFVGLITMSFVLGELASVFISYIGLEVDFRKNHIAIEIYLARLRVSDRLKTRAHAFMTSLWSSHAGVNYEEILGEMPRPIRTACILHVSKEPVDWFIKNVMAPICWDGPDELELFRHSLVEHLHFEGYPSDESIVVEGSIARAMYFVLRGHLRLHSRTILTLTRPIGLHRGDFFGERGLLGCAISPFTVQSVRACDLLSLRSEALSKVIRSQKFSHLALRICEAAHEHLKAKNLVACSRLDMEEHWGTALLEIVNEFRKNYKHPTKIHSANAAALAVVGIQTFTGAIHLKSTMTSGSPVSQLTSVEEIHDEIDDAVQETPQHYLGINPDQLPKHLDRMFYALKDDKDCYTVFSPILHIIMSSDPLDWNASFHPVHHQVHSGETNKTATTVSTKSAWLGKHLDDVVKAHNGETNKTATTVSTQSAWLGKHLDDVVKARDASIQDNSPHGEGSNDAVTVVSNLQQEEDRSPLEDTPNQTLASNFVTRLRLVDPATGRPIENLAPSSDTIEAVTFSMQDANGKTRSSLSFGDDRKSAPPVLALRKRSIGDPTGSARKYTPLEEEDLE
ncbi:LOW QUALITY PROTEIN: Voltage-gated Ion Channel [Phytophthora megakarya]|uniref:Voltage-gated Ion Channel n=1 Tax=Phytophthora megakarya TaxID=4795 RepID=A0A225WDZ4_9STRA|nr:LOW QUALITY PROTEIN: Voltage-gated Ion Channel [Phytophthora megakarya]